MYFFEYMLNACYKTQTSSWCSSRCYSF